MKYSVNLCRTSYAFKTIEIEADSPEAAKDAALDIAGNFLFNENDANYSVEDVSPIVTDRIKELAKDVVKLHTPDR